VTLYTDLVETRLWLRPRNLGCAKFNEIMNNSDDRRWFL